MSDFVRKHASAILDQEIGKKSFVGLGSKKIKSDKRKLYLVEVQCSSI